MSVGRLLVVVVMVLGLLLTAAALAQGNTIQARATERTYTVELPGEGSTRMICTGNPQTGNADCMERPITVCTITEIGFRERANSTARSCKVSNCVPQAGSYTASHKCTCQVKVSDCD